MAKHFTAYHFTGDRNGFAAAIADHENDCIIWFTPNVARRYDKDGNPCGAWEEKAPADATPADTTTATEKKGANTMTTNYKSAPAAQIVKNHLMTVNPAALRGLHAAYGFDFQRPYTLAEINGKFTVNSARAAVGKPSDDDALTVLLVSWTNYDGKPARLHYASLDGKTVAIDGARIYQFGLDQFSMKGTFEDARRKESALCFVISQATEYIRKPAEVKADRSGRFAPADRSGDFVQLDNSGRVFDLMGRTFYRWGLKPEPIELDKSGYIVSERRADLEQRAAKLRANRQKAAYVARDDAAKVDELDRLAAQVKSHLLRNIAASINGTPDEINTAAAALEEFSGVWGLARDVRSFAKSTAEKTFANCAEADKKYNAIRAELLALLPAEETAPETAATVAEETPAEETAPETTAPETAEQPAEEIPAETTTEQKEEAAAMTPATTTTAPAAIIAQGAGWTIYADKALARYRVVLAKHAKNAPALRSAVTAAGFYFSTVTGSYHKKLTNKAQRAAVALAAELAKIAA